MYIKPYKDIETAIQNWRNDYYLRTGEVKIKSHNNIYKDERSLIDATILCKVFKTFEANYDTLKRQYNICHVGHFFWNHTTWQMKYKDATCTFEVHSSDFGEQPEYIRWHFKDNSCSRANIGTYANFINDYIDEVLKNFASYAPKDRYNSIREQILAICNCE
jgi:hypothetical protein